MSIFPNSLARVSVTFSDVTGALADPTSITLRVKTPGGTETTYTYASGQVIRDSVGAYYADVLLTAEGNWSFRWEGAGAVQAAVETAVHVQKSAF